MTLPSTPDSKPQQFDSVDYNRLSCGGVDGYSLPAFGPFCGFNYSLVITSPSFDEEQMINNTSSRPCVARRRQPPPLPNMVYECRVHVITVSRQSSNINNNSLSITNI